MQKHDMNLLERYNEIHRERSKKFSPARVYIVILLGLLLIFSAVSVRFWIQESMLKSDVESLKNYNNSLAVQAKLAEIETLKKNIKFLDQLLSETKSINTVFEEAIRFDSPILEILYYELPDNVGFEAISFSQGVITIELHATKASDFSNYVLRLERGYYFKDVTYDSYTFDSSNSRYYSTVRCVMKGEN
jgi:Tfp pilus assembly protein PilN